MKLCHVASINLTFYHPLFSQVVSPFKVISGLQRIAITDIYSAGAPLINTPCLMNCIQGCHSSKRSMYYIHLTVHVCQHFTFSPLFSRVFLNSSLFREGKPFPAPHKPPSSTLTPSPRIVIKLLNSMWLGAISTLRNSPLYNFISAVPDLASSDPMPYILSSILPVSWLGSTVFWHFSSPRILPAKLSYNLTLATRVFSQNAEVGV